MKHAKNLLLWGIIWEGAVLLAGAYEGWRIVEYVAWGLHCLLSFILIEWMLWRSDDHEIGRVRFRLSLVVYFAALVIFTRVAIVGACAYAIAHRLASRHGSPTLWLSVDFAMIGVLVVYLSQLHTIPDFAVVLQVIVSILTVAITQDRSKRSP